VPGGVRIRLWLVPNIRIGNVDSLEKYLVYGMGMWMVWKGVRSMVWVVVSTRCAEWKCGWLGKVPHVQNGIVDGLERSPKYDLVDDCYRHRRLRFEQGMVWYGTRCTEWERGWFGKVHHVRSGNVNGLERCLEYGLGLQLVLAQIN
jgi:hypothetical protein